MADALIMSCTCRSYSTVYYLATYCFHFLVRKSNLSFVQKPVRLSC